LTPTNHQNLYLIEVKTIGDKVIQIVSQCASLYKGNDITFIKAAPLSSILCARRSYCRVQAIRVYIAFMVIFLKNYLNIKSLLDEFNIKIDLYPIKRINFALVVK